MTCLSAELQFLSVGTNMTWPTPGRQSAALDTGSASAAESSDTFKLASPQHGVPALVFQKRMPASLSPPKQQVSPFKNNAPSRVASVSGSSPDKNHARPLVPETSDAAKREHSRRFSHIHSRNLSAFFPRPGTDAAREYDAYRASQPLPPVQVASAATSSPNTSFDSSTEPSNSPTKRRDRRTERRASYILSNLANGSDMTLRLPSQMAAAKSASSDPTQLISPDPTAPRANSAAWSTLPSRVVSDMQVSPTMDMPHETLRPLPCGASTLCVYSLVHISLGAVLWVLGQIRDSLALVGIGFLLVFDTMGLGIALWRYRSIKMQLKNTTDSFRLPFGPHRFETLLDFSLVLYLFFSGIYMCMENAEHALLASSAPHEEDRAGLILPRTVLAVAVLLCVGTNVVLRNHDRLAAACGMSLDAGDSLDGRPRRSHARHVSVLARPMLAVQPAYDALSNPFAVMILFFVTVLFLSAMLLPPAQAASFDKLVAGLQGASMICVSVTALRPLCKTLLQAAPSAKDTQALKLHKALSVVETHPAVVGVPQIQMWQLALPSLGYTEVGVGTDGKRGLANVLSMRRHAKMAPLVVAVHIKLQRNASVQDCEDVTSLAWHHGSIALNILPHMQVGDMVHSGKTVGDLTVQVTRLGQDADVRVTKHGAHTHCHGHEHGHGHCDGHDHEHDHDHSHENDHDTCHGHHHNHGHVHDYDHDHDHSTHDAELVHNHAQATEMEAP